MAYSLILTCEHAGNKVPDEYKSLFENKEEVLQSHRGWDPGAWQLATYLSTAVERVAIWLFNYQTTYRS